MRRLAQVPARAASPPALVRSFALLPLGAKALILSLTLALVMRVAVSFLGLPGILNFAFFPILIFGLLGTHTTSTSSEALIVRTFGIFSLAVLTSFAVNFADPLASIILWASLATPFIAILVGYRSWLRITTHLGLHHLVLFFVFVQAAPVAFERIVFGESSDAAQGFLGGQGAGHHVVGFIGVGTALYLAMRLLEERELRQQVSVYVAIAAGLATGIITGTMQSLLALGITAIVFLLTRRSRWVVLTPVILAALTIGIIFSSWAAFAPAEKNWYGDDFIEYKGRTITTIAEEFRPQPTTVIFGLGPGETATRAAWLGGSAGNLVGSLGIERGAIGGQLLRAEQLKPLWRSSSLTSPWSTWLGVWGDLGLFGLLAYASVWIVIARACVDRSTNRRAGLYLVLYLAILGAFYNWLEEPVLTLFLGLAVADAVVRTGKSRLHTDPVGETVVHRPRLR